jgi:hypothetical protein
VANTNSIQTRCYALPGYQFDRDEAEWLVCELLGADDPRSYLVPIVVRLSEADTILDVQTGWCSSVDFADQFAGSLDAIWVRHFFDGGDFDSIGRLDVPGMHAQCRYGFDEIRATLAPAADPAGVLPDFPSLEWELLGGGTWRRRAAGTYRAGNNRSVLGREEPLYAASDADLWDGPHQRPGPHMWQADQPVTSLGPAIPTPTSPSYCRGGYHLMDPPAGVVPDLVPELDVVELYWEGRLVHQTTWRDRGRRSQDLAADHWDNCRDEQFLEYVADRDDVLGPLLATAD